ncbi:MAG TPA: hypothetical protein VFJ58_12780 [Armatimonadota bacterium]|nr:hypothetical protein [Armatimonadota bacterium]
MISGNRPGAWPGPINHRAQRDAYAAYYVHRVGILNVDAVVLRCSVGGEDDWIEGYLYSREPLDWKGCQNELDLNLPAFSSPFHASTDCDAMVYDMEIPQKVGPNWYVRDSRS